MELWHYKHANTGDVRERHFRAAFKLMWPNFVFHRWVDMLIEGWCHYKLMTVIGHARSSKSFTLAYIVYLDFCADRLGTMTSISTVTMSGLRDRMFADLLRAKKEASLQLNFHTVTNPSENRIYGTDSITKGAGGDIKFMIEGFATNQSKNLKERIQGKHVDRRRIILDEAQGIPDLVYDAEVNARTAWDYKGVRLANPSDRATVFGRKCEPIGGWDSITVDSEKWETAELLDADGKPQSVVLHFDFLKSHNADQYRDYQSGKISKEEYDKRIFKWQPRMEEMQSEDSSKLTYWMYFRGFFPPEGLVNRVVSLQVLSAIKASAKYDFAPSMAATLDPAIEHDDCVLHIWQLGPVRDGKYCASGVKTYVISPSVGKDEKTGKAYGTKPFEIAKQVIDLCKRHNVPPSHVILDTTGNGTSVHSHMAMEWSREVQACMFYGKATDRRIDPDSETKASDQHRYFIDELHFRFAAYAESGRIAGLDNLDPTTVVDLENRLYEIKVDKMRVEKKVEVKKRLGRSPDYGDSAILISELMERLGYNLESSYEYDVEDNIWLKDAIDTNSVYENEYALETS